MCADELSAGDLVHVPAFIWAPERVDPLEYVHVDFESGLVRLKAADHEWSVKHMDMVTVTKA